MAERARRLSENELLYREVKERVRGLHDEIGLDAEYLELVCECARLRCTERILATRREYEAVRAHGSRFLVRPGHIVPSIEHVVAENDRFATIEKDEGEPARLAESRDPRDPR